jgi:hypothetical protein
MNNAGKLLCAVFLALGPKFPAHAHSWYPQQCCSDHDCMPADDSAKDIRGGMVVIVGQRQIWVPRGFPVRPSPDDRIHICYRVIAVPEEGVIAIPICVFLPAKAEQKHTTLRS